MLVEEHVGLASVEVGQVSLHVVEGLDVSEPVQKTGEGTGLAEGFRVDYDARLLDNLFLGEAE